MHFSQRVRYNGIRLLILIESDHMKLGIIPKSVLDYLLPSID